MAVALSSIALSNDPVPTAGQSVVGLFGSEPPPSDVRSGFSESLLAPSGISFLGVLQGVLKLPTGAEAVSHLQSGGGVNYSDTELGTEEPAHDQNLETELGPQNVSVPLTNHSWLNGPPSEMGPIGGRHESDSVTVARVTTPQTLSSTVETPIQLSKSAVGPAGVTQRELPQEEFVNNGPQSVAASTRQTSPLGTSDYHAPPRVQTVDSGTPISINHSAVVDQQGMKSAALLKSSTVMPERGQTLNSAEVVSITSSAERTVVPLSVSPFSAATGKLIREDLSSSTRKVFAPRAGEGGDRVSSAGSPSQVVGDTSELIGTTLSDPFSMHEAIRATDFRSRFMPAGEAEGQNPGGAEQNVMYPAENTRIQLAGSPDRAAVSAPPKNDIDSITGFSDRFVNSVVEVRGRGGRDGVEEIRLRLDPPNLGEVVVRLRTSGGSVQAELQVADEAVRAMIEVQLPELRQRLDAAGVTVSKFDVGTQAGNDFHQQQTSQDRLPWDGSNAGMRSPTSTAEKGAPTAVRHLGVGELVDITA